MPRADWPLLRGRPRIEIVFTRISDRSALIRQLLGDTGAGSAQSAFDLVLREAECIDFGQILGYQAVLAGAYSGHFSVYLLHVEMPALGFSRDVRAVAVPTPPAAFDGIACFSFLNQFTYDNFGDPARFGLEV